jgi:hypothetical protein
MAATTSAIQPKSVPQEMDELLLVVFERDVLLLDEVNNAVAAFAAFPSDGVIQFRQFRAFGL